MVFESISKSLKSMASSTTDMAKKAADTTGEYAGKAISPFEKMTKSVTKHIPFMGDEMSLWTQASVQAKKKNTTAAIVKELKKFLTATNKLKLPVSKSKALKAGINDLVKYFGTLDTLEQVTESYHTGIKSWKKQIDTSIPDTYTEGEWKASKKVTLTVTQAESVMNYLDIHTNNIDTAVADIEKQDGLLVPAFSSTPDLTHSLDVYRKEEQDIINSLIDKKYEIVTQQKKLSYLVRDLERNDTKLESHKNTITRNKITDIVNNKIPNNLTVLGQLKEGVAKLEKQWTESAEKLEKNYTTVLTAAQKVRDTHDENADKSVAAHKKSEASSTKTESTSYKKYHSAHVKLWDVTLKSPYDMHEDIKKGMDTEAELYHVWASAQTSALTTQRDAHIHPTVSAKLHQAYIQKQIDISYDQQLVQKTQKLQLGLLNSVNKKQVKTAESIVNQAEKLSNSSNVKLGTLKKSFDTLVKDATAIVKDNEARKELCVKKTKELATEITLMKSGLTYGDTLVELTRADIEGQMVSNKLAYINADIEDSNTGIKAITEKSKLLNKLIKKERVELEDKQQTAKTTGTKKDEKAVTDVEHLIQEQELTLDMIKHHVDHEKELLSELKDAKSEYISQAKSLKSDLSKLKKKEKEGRKKVKKVW